MNFKLLSLLAILTLVSAQTPPTGPGTETPGPEGPSSTEAPPSGTGGAPGPSGTPSACVTGCVAQAASTAGCSPTDPECACNNPAFQSAAQQCLSTCSAEDQAAAQSLQNQICGGASPSGSGIPTPSGSVTGSATTAGGVSTPSAVRPSSALPTTGVPRPTTSNSATRTATGTGASTTTTNAAVPIAAQGAWAMAAGVLGLAVAL